MTDRLLLVRHGVTTWNREGRFQGHLDPPLDPIGLQQAQRLGARLAAEEPGPMRIVTSPLLRAAATADLLAAALEEAGIAVDRAVHPGLMEIGQGEWSGRTHMEIEREDPVRYAAWRAGGGRVTPPGGEALGAAAERIVAAMDDLLRPDGASLCLVSHGGILRLAAGHLLGLAPTAAWELDVDNASLSRLTRATAAEPWRIEVWNDTTHLPGQAPIHGDEAGGAPVAL
ncbi:MAG TPA: histidine phosphatase family protein [Candidatus Limnocylindria bacterium]|nr:histidine phosphatase family protein [Candidatus Limnocylindria bacterium]